MYSHVTDLPSSSRAVHFLWWSALSAKKPCELIHATQDLQGLCETKQAREAMCALCPDIEAPGDLTVYGPSRPVRREA